MQRVCILSKDLHSYILPYSCHQFIEAHFNGLCCFKSYTGKILLESDQHSIHESLVIICGGPLVLVLEYYDHIRVKRGHRISGCFCRT